MKRRIFFLQTVIFCGVSAMLASGQIYVHTDLNTIETPEERELLKDGEDSRFSKFYGRYREASYSRFDNRREAFLYTKNLAEIKQTLVVIREGQTD